MSLLILWAGTAPANYHDQTIGTLTLRGGSNSLEGAPEAEEEHQENLFPWWAYFA